MGLKNFCVHGHFYQPPREDPETGRIPDEPGAEGFGNWNEKITSQCYLPNAELGNFSRISFDLGPTLGNWLAQAHPQLHRAILDQEAEFFEKNGVSNAMAQSYHHTILPLSPRADMETQVRWGIADYEARFGRRPLGLWAPETAVNLETLDVLAENGIRFTILAPWQAEPSDALDPSRPYRVALPGGREIAVFFFERELSLNASFDPDATLDADRYLRELLAPMFPARGRIPRTFVIASDGELYGHHQPNRAEFLCWLTTGAAEAVGVTPLVPAQVLRDAKKLNTVKIRENTSWSCHHGVERWRGVCGCAERGGWKAPLREALNFLADVIDFESERALGSFGLGLQETRNDYGRVLVGAESADAFAARRLGSADGAAAERVKALMAVQLDRHRMFTSCGWYFETFDRIEPKNNIRAAARAVRRFDALAGTNLKDEMAGRLSAVQDAASGLRGDEVFLNG